MGKKGAGSSWSESGSESVSFAPVQLGAETSANAFRPEWFETALNGLYGMIRDTVKSTFDSLGGGKGIATELKNLSQVGLQGYEEKMDQIADQMMVSFAQNVKPDDVMMFPLDDFVQSSIKEIYSKAGDIYANPTLSRAELKTMIDSNIGNISTQFAQRRRAIEQEISARGLTGPAAAEARNQAEMDIARSREGIARDTLATEFANKKSTQLAALGQMGQASAMGQQYTGQLSQRWLDQWRTKLSAEGLRQQGLNLQLGYLQGAAGIEQQQFGNVYNLAQGMLGMGQNFLGGVNAQAIDEYKAHVAAYGGAASSSSWSQSEGQGQQGSFGLPFGIWQQNY